MFNDKGFHSATDILPYTTPIINVIAFGGNRYTFELAADGNVLAYSRQAALMGDFNGDGSVDQADYTTWADRFDQSDSAFAAGTCNGDGVIDQADYTTWADHFGQQAAR